MRTFRCATPRGRGDLAPGAWRAALLAACLAAACLHRPAAEPGPAPYVVSIDVTEWVRALAKDFIDRDPAVEALTAIGPPVIPVLEKAWEQEPARAHAGIVEVLDELAAPETLPLLLRAARDLDPEVRADAVAALGELGDERGRKAVQQALHDPEITVVAAAADACRTLCSSPEAMEELVRRAAAGLARARQSASAILHAADPERAATVRAALEHAALPVLNDAAAGPDIRARTALLLLPVHPETALPALRSYAFEGKVAMLRAEAILALGEAGGERDATLLGRLRAADPGSPFATLACHALNRMAGRGVPAARDRSKECSRPGVRELD